MLQSMTGFGKAESTFQNKKITIEIRSLNSKGGDVYVKIPTAYKVFELLIRKEIDKYLYRGKIECTVSVEHLEGLEKPSINKSLAIAYFKEMKEVADALGSSTDGLLSSVFRLSDVMQVKEIEIKEEEAAVIQATLQQAIQKTIEYRTQEGKTLENDFSKAIDAIEEGLLQVPKYEEIRIEKIKERIQKKFEELEEATDKNRFEQELIYYIEKLDISEEKTRLQHHLDYFRTTMHNEAVSGKKLGFISQEIGREINTLGSKSYNAELQKIVVEMKDNLEKIKEQILNTL